MVQSHIQMPRLVMKNFADSNGTLWYYDCSDGKVKRGFAKSLYTEWGYYSDEIEKFIGTDIETHLGDLIKFLKTTNWTSEEKPPALFSEIAYDYLYSLIARSPSMIEATSRNSIFYQFLADVDKHDYAVYAGINIARRDNLLRQYHVSFLVNMSSEELVLPTGGVTSCNHYLFCPVSPNIAIAFNDIKELESDEAIDVFEIDDQNLIHLINLQSFIQENNRDRKYIISRDKSHIEQLASEVRAMESQQ